MKRFWLGVAILGVLLILGVILTVSMDAIHSQIAVTLQQAQDAAFAGDWDAATRMAQKAQDRWEHYWRFTAAFADHNPMDELDGLFAELMIFSQEREMPHFAAVCAHLSQLARSMANSHGVGWWNLL